MFYYFHYRAHYEITATFCLFNPLFIQQRGRADDPVAYLRANEQRARERQIAFETVKLLRQDVIHCYREHGVNHYEKCRKVAQAYYDVITKKGLGQVQPDWSDPKKKDGW